MGRVTGKLTDAKIRSAVEGKYGDGDGLWLMVSMSGSKRWAYRFMLAGRSREMGLGAYPKVKLAEARVKALDARRLLDAGIDPIEHRIPTAIITIPTFGASADDYIAAHKAGWRSKRHLDQWQMTMRVYAEPLRNMPVNEIATEHVLKVLKELWQRAPETASRVRARIELVLSAAKAFKFRSGENPAAWRGHLDKLLPRQSKLSRGHFAALDYAEIPSFVARLRKVESVQARALEFAVLTAARSAEVLGARWSEFDTDAAVWTIPAERMKAGREHRIPLSDRAVAILAEMAAIRASGTVFAGRGINNQLSVTALTGVLKRMGARATTHGFRSSFRDWAGNESPFPRELAEHALAHALGDKTEQSYRRSDALEKRRALMEAWAAYCEPVPAGNVVT